MSNEQIGQASGIAREKIAAARRVLEELNLDGWLLFVRETGDGGDPVLPLVFGHDLTWQSAIVIPREKSALPGPVAIVGTHDAQLVRSTGLFTETIGYVEGIRDPLRALLARFDPRVLALNYSTDDVKADGLTHGMYLLLREHLAGTPYVDRLTSAADVVRLVRGRKSPTEIARIRTAIATTHELFEELERWAVPGTSERAVWEFVQSAMRTRGVEPAWSSAGCPIVTTSPRSMGGHGVASPDLSITPGCIFHIDLGVRQDDYCSDLQRSWYVPREGETSVPDDVRRAFEAVRASVDAAFDVLKVGTEGWRIDEAARSTLVRHGWPEYDHAAGHEVGRAAHDGGVVLGPRWQRYGQTPFRRVEVGHVVTLELGVDVPERGYLGLEEMAIVTEAGPQWLSRLQRGVPLLASTSGTVNSRSSPTRRPT